MGFKFPTVIEIPEEFHPYACSKAVSIDVEYEIQLLKEPLKIDGSIIFKYKNIDIYTHEGGYLRVFSTLTAKDGSQVACVQKRAGKNILFYPASRWDYFSKKLQCKHLIGIENILIQYDALLLHSSVVEMNGKTVLFSGPSGIGKSTQADLWRQHLNAEIINGDRCVIRKINGQFYGCGSPWAGTSRIYSSKMTPIAGIFILKQANQNRIRRMKADAFLKLYQQCVVNTWDTEFVEKLSDLLAELLTVIPVYELECMPNEEAVRQAYQILFEGGVSGWK